jgi:4-amino-4-deoxy-L-arabinose transferase-like glycosyltransferase
MVAIKAVSVPETRRRRYTYEAAQTLAQNSSIFGVVLETRETASASARIFLFAIPIAFAIRVALIPFLYTEWLDPFVLEHWAFGRIARSLVQGHGFGSPFADTGTSALLPPVYCYVLAAVFKVFGIYTKTAIIAAAVLNSLISAFICIPVYFIAHKSFDERVARWSVWGWAFSPYGIYFSADWLWSTCLFTLLLAFVFLFALYLEETTSLARWGLFGLLAGVTALTEPVVLAVLPFLGMWTCWRLWKRSGQWLPQGTIAAICLAAVLTPWFVRNYEAFHRFIPVRSGFGLELYMGNSGYSTHWANRTVHPNHNDAELAEYVNAGEVAYMAHKQRQALDYIEAHPGWFAWMSIRRAIYLWTGYWSFDKQYLHDEPLDPPNVFVGTILSSLALAGLWRALKIKPVIGVRFAGVLLFFPLAYYISHPEAYYFRPLDPLILILGIYAVTGWVKRRKAHA